MKKLLSLLLFLLVAGIFATSASAAYTYNKVEVNGVAVTGYGVTTSPVVYVERGGILSIRTEFSSNVDAKDVKVKAWIGGYEYDDIEDISDLFDVSANAVYVKNLALNLPDDLDASKDYTLHVEVYDTNTNAENEYTLRVNEQRHYLNFVDIIFNPGLSVRADQPLFVSARLENLGDKKEQDVRVSVSIPELGISQRTFIDDLTPFDDAESQKESSESTESLFLDLSDVKPGNYNLVVKAEYNRGHDFIEKAFPLTVKAAKQAVKAEDLIVDVAEKSKDVQAGQGIVYKVSLANLANDAKTLTLEVAGFEGFGTARIDPSSLTVESDSSKEALIYVSAKENAEAGNKLFTLRVKEGNAVLKEVQLQANVKDNLTATSSLRTGLEVGFVVLLIILVILGIILAINKLRGKEDSEQSYY